MGNDHGDLVILSVPGVQRFIAESRTTRDLANSSQIISDIGGSIVTALADTDGVCLILPSPGHTSTPNKIVCLAPTGKGASVAAAAAAAARRFWDQRVAELLGTSYEPAPNFPVVNWVTVPSEERTYAEQWLLAMTTLAARRRVRDFVPIDQPKARRVCSVTGRWTALTQAPSVARPQDRKEPLSTVAWAKRGWSRAPVASTSSIASASFRAWVAAHLEQPGIRDAVRDLRSVALASFPPIVDHSPSVPAPVTADREARWLHRAGASVQTEFWTVDTVTESRATRPQTRWPEAPSVSAKAGEQAARKLRELAEAGGGPRPARYLAVIAQDLDDMGKRLSGDLDYPADPPLELTSQWQQELSTQLLAVSTEQRKALENVEALGKIIYAGGDDLLALLPASTALAAARAVHDVIAASGPDLPTASTAVYFFHQNGSLSDAIRRTHQLLADAKAIPGKHALAVGFQRRSGNHYTLARPWTAASSGKPLIELLEDLRDPGDITITPGLLAQLRRDSHELSGLLQANSKVCRAELHRLVGRHLTTEGGAIDAQQVWSEALFGITSQLGTHYVDWVGAARLGLFLRQECAG